MITRRHDASRVNAIFLGAQALSQGAVAALTPTTLEPLLGANSGLWVICGGAALTLPLLLLIPNQLPELPAEMRLGSGLQLSSVSGLASGLLMMGGIVGVWVYVEPIAHTLHIQDKLVSLAIAASLGAQVVGATAIVALDRWVKSVSGLLLTTAAFLAVTAAFAWPSSQVAFVAATVAFGLFWTIALALGLPLLIAADPTRRAAMYGPAATLLGSSLGPLAAGAFATNTNMKPALATAAALFVLSAVATAVSAQTRPHVTRGR
jgi:predicted MFS family arabinose efflux permease